MARLAIGTLLLMGLWLVAAVVGLVAIVVLAAVYRDGAINKLHYAGYAFLVTGVGGSAWARLAFPWQRVLPK